MKSLPARDRWPLIIFPVVLAMLLGIYPISRHGEALIDQAKLASQRGDHAAAALRYQQAAAQLPAHPELWEIAGTSFFTIKDIPQAIQSFETARKHQVLSIDGLVSLAEAYELQSNYDSAVLLLEEAAGQGEGSDEIVQALVRVYIDAGNLEQAAAALEERIRDFGNLAGYAYQLGLLYSVTEPALAHAAFLEAGSAEPAYSSRISRIENAITVGQREKNEAYRLTITAQALGSVNEWRLAQAALERALEHSPNYAEAWALAGEAAQQLGGDGGEELQHALGLNPQSLLSLTLAAIRCERRQEWEQAIAYLIKVSGLDEQNPLWQVELGAAYARNGDLSEAYTSYQKAVTLDPENASTWRELAVFSLTYNYGIDDTALPAARQAVQLEPEAAASLDVLAQAYMSTGDVVSAVDFLQRAISFQPEYAPAYLHLGIIQKDQGHYADARQSFSQAVQLDPTSSTALQAQRMLDELALLGILE